VISLAEPWVLRGWHHPRAHPAVFANDTRRIPRIWLDTHEPPRDPSTLELLRSSITTAGFRLKSHSWRLLTKLATTLDRLTTILVSVGRVVKTVCFSYSFGFIFKRHPGSWLFSKLAFTCWLLLLPCLTKGIKEVITFSCLLIWLGNYIMFASATSGERPNNSRFSNCSVGNISSVLEAIEEGKKKNCFTGNITSFLFFPSPCRSSAECHVPFFYPFF